MAFIGASPQLVVSKAAIKQLKTSVCMARTTHATGGTSAPVSRRSLLAFAATAAGVALNGRAAVFAEPMVSIEDVVVGTGATPVAGATVKVHYTLTLSGFEGEEGSKVVDSSRSRRKPFRYQYMGGQVIKGWEMGVEGMKVGSRRRITIPSELGYGSRGAGGVIPPNATLYFDIELLGINN